MKKTITFTLVADGSSDRCLIHPLRWVIMQTLRRQGSSDLIQLVFARVGPNPLKARIQEALAQYPCDILLIHRDAEKDAPERRFEEIANATANIDNLKAKVPVVPVRMSEAWLLISEPAIRAAAANRSGKAPLRLPRPRDLESHPNPKQALQDALLSASEATGRRRERLKRDISSCTHRVAEQIDDYSALRQLSAFKRLESDFEAVLAHSF